MGYLVKYLLYKHGELSSISGFSHQKERDEQSCGDTPSGKQLMCPCEDPNSSSEAMLCPC